MSAGKTVSIDVAGLSVGRAATQIAVMLRGKNHASFERHIPANVTVEVKNADKVKIFSGKLTGTVYTRYSGYPGGLKTERLGEVFSKDPKEVLRRAVWGMLPKNKLRRIFIKRLKFA